MSVTGAVGLTAFAAAVIIFVLSAVRGLPDPVDSAAEEREVVRRLKRHPRLAGFLRRRLDRTTAGGLVLTVSLLVTFGTALAVGVVLDMIAHSVGLASLDNGVAQWGVGHATSRAVDLLKVITYFGDTAVVAPALVAAGIIDHYRHRRLDVFLFLGVAFAGEKLIVNGLKEIVARSRPDVGRLVPWDGPSFPSGHSAAAAMAWPAIALVLGRGLPRLMRAVLAAAAALIAIAVAASRALLGVHWLTDVIAGVAIGYGWFMVCAVVFGGRAQRLGAPLTRSRRG